MSVVTRTLKKYHVINYGQAHFMHLANEVTQIHEIIYSLNTKTRESYLIPFHSLQYDNLRFQGFNFNLYCMDRASCDRENAMSLSSYINMMKEI